MNISIPSLSASERVLLGKCPLFSGFPEPDLDFALRFFGAERVTLSQGESLLNEGDPISFFGLVLSGKIRVSMTAITGEELLMAGVLPGGTFGESLCYLRTGSAGISVRADLDSVILRMSTDHLQNSLLSPETAVLPVQNQEKSAPSGGISADHADPTARNAEDLNAARLSRLLTDRFLRMLAHRALSMNRRIQTLTRTTLRRKLIAFFSECRDEFGSDAFTVPMDREGLASYLGTNRSALSRELSAMKKDGLIDFRRNEFRLCR